MQEMHLQEGGSMRVIKFRGKDKHTGKWVFGDLAHSKGISTDGLYDRVMVGGYHVIEDTIGQFSGLLDKTGKEIYEGDMLVANGRLIGYVVGGVRGYCYDVVYTPPLANGETSWSLYGVVVNDHPNEIEVSSNVFDNPELLKGGDE